ncbi:sn-glycerol-3-phosphate ABC transporter permease UgpA [Cysteiniphilum sp. JM-1]|uniref:sn-glycerol-3-phosphate ABC transporter permease UgpA n=1 Tax=Cysteiniphilum sp. JM-1 TaxID=2610891 RepID=UPI0012447B5A|nr:sn-glycerol-3-phosphate ABC transporter permease UgpA [Cysteiniphilum sp. JM-1]
MHHRGFYKAGWLPYLLILPQLVITLLFFIYPAIQSIISSFYSSNFWGTVSHFVGFENYWALLSDSSYLQSFITTAIFSVAVTFLAMGLGLLFAVLVMRVIRGVKIYKTFILWPYAVATAVTGVLWGFLFNPAVGVVTWVLAHFGVDWNYYSNGTQALMVTIFGASWQQVSYNFIFFLAGLAAVPKSMLEAAAIDGAGPIRRFWQITFPLISPTTFFLLTINLVYAFFDTFGIIATMTQGGPADSTNILVYNVYATGFIGQQIGSSSAQSVILMLIIIILSVIQFKYIEKKVHYA